MKVWLLWIQGDDHTWLEGAWDDDTTAENRPGWDEEVARVRRVADENDYQMRIQAVEVPGVHDLFDIPTVKASPV